MSVLKETLQRLEGAPGIQGALVMTPDGVIVAMLDETPFPDETAAHLSTIMLAMESEAVSLGLDPLKRLTLWADHGRLIVIPFQELALVVVADAITDLGSLMLEVTSVALALQKKSRIEV